MGKKIVLTGGGTAGHVTPIMAMIPELRARGYEMLYVGSENGIEKSLMADYPDIPYVGVSTGKFRRYRDIKNLTDPFRVIKGYFQAKKAIRKFQPNVLFSKGGFVAVPPVRAAQSLKVPTVIHESDMRMGLANKLCARKAKKVCCNFPGCMKDFPGKNTVLTGTPIREELLHGDREKGLAMCGFDGSKPVLMVIGGSQGAVAVNRLIREGLPKLLPQFDVVHLCGKDKIDNLLLKEKGYRQYEYIKEELRDLFAMADVVVSRAGANAICELLALHKPNILIPLPNKDQIMNAASFEEQGFSMVAEQEEITASELADKVAELYETREKYVAAMEASPQSDAIKLIVDMLDELADR